MSNGVKRRKTNNAKYISSSKWIQISILDNVCLSINQSWKWAYLKSKNVALLKWTRLSFICELDYYPPACCDTQQSTTLCNVCVSIMLLDTYSITASSARRLVVYLISLRSKITCLHKCGVAIDPIRTTMLLHSPFPFPVEFWILLG